MPRSARLLSVVALVVLLMTGSFSAGFAVANHPAPVQGTPVATPTEDPTRADFEQRLSVFSQAVKLVEDEFYDKQALQNPEVVYGAIRGLIEPLGDPYTSFVNPREAEIQGEDLSGKFDGIGAEIEVKDNRLLIVAPQQGTPAERAGLRPGDHITRIDGKPTDGLSATDAVALIRGPRGTAVVLTIAREGVAAPFDVCVVRDEIKLKYVAWEMLPDGLAYLRLTSFGEVTTDFVNALREIRKQQARGLILDLRSNPGGYLEVAIDVASQFLDRGIVLKQQERSGEPQKYPVKPGGLTTDTPMVVLVNHGSASASEIVAGALQDYRRATLIGETTFGKGSVQKVHTLSDKSSLRVTTAHWLTPNGREINQKGLEPDIVVPTPETPPKDRSEDTQLQRAIEFLKEKQGAAVPSTWLGLPAPTLFAPAGAPADGGAWNEDDLAGPETELVLASEALCTV